MGSIFVNRYLLAIEILSLCLNYMVFINLRTIRDSSLINFLSRLEHVGGLTIAVGDRPRAFIILMHKNLWLLNRVIWIHLRWL